MPRHEWPPENGKDFVRSEPFGFMLVELTSHLASRYPEMDFTDAVAQVFVWFDYKLSENRRFINSRRFPSIEAFQAYLRQAVWNAGVMAMRRRRRREAVEALPVDQAIVSTEMAVEERIELIEMVDGLPEPHKSVFERFFFGEEDLAMIASILDLTEDQADELYEQ